MNELSRQERYRRRVLLKAQLYDRGETVRRRQLDLMAQSTWPGLDPEKRSRISAWFGHFPRVWDYPTLDDDACLYVKGDAGDTAAAVMLLALADVGIEAAPAAAIADRIEEETARVRNVIEELKSLGMWFE